MRGGMSIAAREIWTMNKMHRQSESVARDGAEMRAAEIGKVSTAVQIRSNAIPIYTYIYIYFLCRSTRKLRRKVNLCFPFVVFSRP